LILGAYLKASILHTLVPPFTQYSHLIVM